jgi:hypothetical protein
MASLSQNPEVAASSVEQLVQPRFILESALRGIADAPYR